MRGKSQMRLPEIGDKMFTRNSRAPIAVKVWLSILRYEKRISDAYSESEGAYTRTASEKTSCAKCYRRVRGYAPSLGLSSLFLPLGRIGS